MAAFSFVSLCLLFHGGALGLRLHSRGPPGIETVDNGEFGKDFVTVDYQCGDIADVGVEPLMMCKDNWQSEKLRLNRNGESEEKPCVVYDLGVRDQPQFALNMIENWGCVVRAYDPSETTRHWWNHDVENLQGPNGRTLMPTYTGNDPKVDRLKLHEKEHKYKLYHEAAAEKDGDLTLYAYNWQQVSNFKATTGGENQQAFVVPAKSLASMMETNGDKFIDVLKVDIEGSEFDFLQGMHDTMGCPPAEHLLLEWHSTNMDYKTASPPEVKMWEDRFAKCGYKKYHMYRFEGKEPIEADPLRPEEVQDFDIQKTYYGHSAYCRNCWKNEENNNQEAWRKTGPSDLSE